MASRDPLPDAFSRLQLERQSTPAQITEVLEAEILKGALRPGDRLREVQLAEMFGVSRNTLREALRVLEREGLVRHIPHRGAVVTELTAEQVEDVYAARTVLETAALRAVARSRESTTGLREAIEAIEAAAAARDARHVVEQDFTFHRRLVERLGSPRLDAFFLSLLRDLRLVLSQLDSSDPSPQVGEHREILVVLEAGRVDDAEALLTRHLAVARERVIEMLGTST